MSQAVDDLDEAPPSFGERLRRALAVPGRLLGALFLPDKWMPREVASGRFGAAILAVMLCGLLGALAIGYRLDVSTDVLAAASRGPGGPGGPGGGAQAQAGGGGPGGGGAQAAKSDREIEEEIARDLAVARVMRALEAGLWEPFKILILGLMIYLLLIYVGGKPTLPRAMSAVAHAALPGAVRALVLVGAASQQASLTPKQADSLIPDPIAAGLAGAPPVLAKLLGGVDGFMIWSLVLLGLGMATAGEVSRKRAFTTLIVVLLLYLAISNVIVGGGGGPPPGPGVERM